MKKIKVFGQKEEFVEAKELYLYLLHLGEILENKKYDELKSLIQYGINQIV